MINHVMTQESHILNWLAETLFFVEERLHDNSCVFFSN